MEWKNIKYVTYHVQTHVVRALYNYGCDWYIMKNIWNYGKWNILTTFEKFDLDHIELINGLLGSYSFPFIFK